MPDKTAEIFAAALKFHEVSGVPLKAIMALVVDTKREPEPEPVRLIKSEGGIRFRWVGQGVHER